MRICRFGEVGAERPGLVSPDGVILDLSRICHDIGPAQLAPDALAKLVQVDRNSLPKVDASVRMGVPWTGISKIIGIGLNYSDHAAESGMAVPSEPIVFFKPPSSICGPNDDTVQPRDSTMLDWEIELGVVIGIRATYVEEADALDYVAGYCVFNDVSERAFQNQSAQWDKGKSSDTFGPTGPWLVTKDEVPDPQALDMWLDVNGVRRQTGNTRTMIFGVKQLVAYCSRYMTLMPGDLIATGTPPGVGLGMKPKPVWLRPGDTVELGISGLGDQRQSIVGFSRR